MTGSINCEVQETRPEADTRLQSGGPTVPRYALLEAVLALRDLRLKAIYTVRDAAEIFNVSTRTVQDWVRDGKLIARDLPGRGRFLPLDMEVFLQSSVKKRQKAADETHLSDGDAEGHIRGNVRKGRLTPRHM
jgi:excisionase family DNA binding protein